MTPRACRLLSVVVPVLNEEDNIPELIRRLKAALDGGLPFEIDFVDDGSTDRTWRLLTSLHAEDPRIKSIRLASEVPEAERTNLEVLRDDRPVFTRFVESRRNRADEWYIHKAGHIDVCNITVPVRDAKLGSRPIS